MKITALILAIMFVFTLGIQGIAIADPGPGNIPTRALLVMLAIVPIDLTTRLAEVQESIDDILLP